LDGSNPEHYPIADFVNWYKQKELILNPEFQRGSVWSSQARSYLIDSILRGYPLPKLLMRTRIDRSTRKTIRDVVDGQQRLRTVIDFVENRLTLGIRAREFNGMRFDDLDDDVQDKFLAYKLTSEQLINASDDDVLEVFVRINSYTVPVNDAELRNAKFDNEFSNVVKSTVRQLSHVWDLGVLAPRARVRMADQSLVAEIYGFKINGIGEGGEASITKLYQQMDKENAVTPDSVEIEAICDAAAELLEPFRSQRIVQRPHFLMLVAVLGYLRGVLRPGRIDVANMPVPKKPSVVDTARESLGQLNDALNGDLERDELEEFVSAARSSTQRIKSRQTRFSYFYEAVTRP
jgi:hypothetical protein